MGVKKLKLTDRDEQILSVIQGRAEATVPVISNELGIHARTVTLTVKKFIDNDIITFRPFIDVYPMGLKRYGIYLTLSIAGHTRKQAIMDWLSEQELVSLVLEFSGRFDLEVNINVRDEIELSKFVENLQVKFKDCIETKIVALQQFHTAFYNKVASKAKTPRAECSYGLTDKRIAIDEKDHEILKALSQKRIYSAPKISRETGIPQRTVDYRLKNLEKNGILKGYTYLIYRSRIGSFNNFILLLRMKENSERMHKRVVQFAWEHPAVCYYVRVLSEWDYEISVELERRADITKVIADVSKAFKNDLQEVTNLVYLSAPKVVDYPFRRWGG